MATTINFETPKFALLIILCLGFLLQSCRSKSLEERINELREETQKSLDSSAKHQSARYAFYDSISLAIERVSFDSAKHSLDSMLQRKPHDNFLWRLRGDLFALHANYSEAIEDYSLAVSRDSFPISFEKRATIFILLKRFPEAINDLRYAAEINTDYLYSIGYTYELAGNIDSAISFYSRYLELNKNSEVESHLDSLLVHSQK